MPRDTSPPVYDAVEELVDIRAIWVGLRRQTALVAGVMATTLLALLAYILLAESLYTAETTIVIQPKTEMFAYGDEPTSQARPDPLLVETEVELLRSSAMAARVLQRLADEKAGGTSDREPTDYMDFLTRRFFSEPISDSALEPAPSDGAEAAGKEPPALIEADAPAVVAETPPSDAGTSASAPGLSGSKGAILASLSPAAPPIAAREVEALMERIEVERVGTTTLIKLRALSSDPEEAARIANLYAEEFIIEKVEAKFADLRRANQWIDTRLAALRDEVREAEEETVSLRAKEGVVEFDGRTTGSFADQRIAAIATELRDAKSALTLQRSRYAAMQDMLKSGRGSVGVGDVAASPLLEDLRARLSAANQRIAEYTARYGERHPQLKAVRQEAEALSRQIDAEMRRAVDVASAELQLATARVRALEADLAETQGELAARTSTAVRLQELDRDLQAPRAVYEALLNRKKELNERDRLLEADARIVARAATPEHPSRPRRKLLLAGGVFLAALLGGGAAFTAEMLDGRIRNTRDIRLEFGDGAPVVMVPRVSTRGVFRKLDAADVARRHLIRQRDGLYAEAMRDLRMHVKALQARKGGGSTVVAFSSVFGGEGRSTTAFSLAALLASSGHRVAFVDCAGGFNVRGDEDGDEELFQAESGESEAASTEPVGGAIESPKAAETEPRASACMPAPVQLDAVGATALTAIASPCSSAIAEIVKSHPDLPMEARGEVCRVQIGRLRAYSALRHTDDLDFAAFKRVIETMRGHFDYVIIDAPDLMSKSEASLIAAGADAVAVAVEWCRTTRAGARVAVQRLLEARAQILAFVVVKADERQRYYFRPEDRNFYYRRSKPTFS